MTRRARSQGASLEDRERDGETGTEGTGKAEQHCVLIGDRCTKVYCSKVCLQEEIGPVTSFLLWRWELVINADGLNTRYLLRNVRGILDHSSL